MAKSNEQNEGGTRAGDSDVDNIDFDNFKGIHFNENMEKYHDPVTGCHFEYNDFCHRL